MRTVKHFALATMAAAALALAGCGGGGSGGTASAPTPQPMPVDTSGVAAGAMAQAGSYMIAAGQSATHGDVTYSCPAGGADCVVDVMADGTTTSTGGMATAMNSAGYDQRVMLVAQINALRTQLGLDANADIGDTVAQLQTDLADLQKQVDDAQDAEDKAAREAAAKEARALFAGIDETATNLTVAVTAVNDKHGGGMASVTATGLTPGVGLTSATKSAEPMLGMWQGTMLTDSVAADAATNAGTSSTVVVYTDIEADKAVPFGDVHTLTNDALPIDADADADPHVKLISASAFTHAGRVNHDPDPTAADDVARIRGMFNGASGEYRCTAATATSCGSIESSMGIRLAGTWVFDPDSGAMAMQADTSYAYFGWWLNKGTTEGVEAGAFHGVTDLTGADAKLAVPTSIDALGGMATYSGSAAGKYAINPGLSTASGGHWTADATLTADFGDETAPGTMSGMIDNFMAGGETMDWSIALGATVLSTAGAADTAGDTSADTGSNAVIWTIGGVAGAEAGTWESDLYAEGDNGVPTVATGMFTATHGTVGHMIGAFGAKVE